jgi:hypothetical protein
VTQPSRYPALAEWQRQLSLGMRTCADFDDLWRAAAAEMWAEEHEVLGLHAVAHHFRVDALRIIGGAARAQRRGP